MRKLHIQILSVKMHAVSNNVILIFFTFLAWNTAACLWGGGRWWWSSSRLRWSWGSAGIAAEGLTGTRRWPGRPLSEPWTPSFHPLRQWSGTDTRNQRLAAVPLRSLASCAELSRFHLCSGLTTGFRLRSHSSLQLLRQLHILDLHTLHLDAPRIGGFIQGLLQEESNCSDHRD